jgi:glutathione synthase/RimK-type ligase-like ATP-grasp enzyme
MHLHVKALREALTSLHMSFSAIPDFHDSVIAKDMHFIRTATPFNTESVSALCRDKAALHKVLDGKVPMPKTKSFIDPNSIHAEQDLDSIKAIAESVSDFVYPRIVKMNQGERANNTFIVKNETETTEALRCIFDKSARYYDYIALVQEYIRPKRELRVAVAAGRPQFVFDRASKSILHGALGKKAAELSELIIKEISISWAAIDFIESDSGEVYFLEANTRHNFEDFMQVNGLAEVKNLYIQAIQKHGKNQKRPS